MARDYARIYTLGHNHSQSRSRIHRLIHMFVCQHTSDTILYLVVILIFSHLFFSLFFVGHFLNYLLLLDCVLLFTPQYCILLPYSLSTSVYPPRPSHAPPLNLLSILSFTPSDSPSVHHVQDDIIHFIFYMILL